MEDWIVSELQWQYHFRLNIADASPYGWQVMSVREGKIIRKIIIFKPQGAFDWRQPIYTVWLTAGQQAVNTRWNGADSKSSRHHEHPFDGVRWENCDDIILANFVTHELSCEKLCASDEVVAGDRFAGQGIFLSKFREDNFLQMFRCSNGIIENCVASATCVHAPMAGEDDMIRKQTVQSEATTAFRSLGWRSSAKSRMSGHSISVLLCLSHEH